MSAWVLDRLVRAGAARHGWTAIALTALAALSAASCGVPRGRDGRLTTIQQLSALSAGEAARAVPVQIEGAVTYRFPETLRFIVEDATGSAEVDASGLPPGDSALSKGQRVRLTGHSWRTPTANGLLADSVRVLETNRLPTPIHVTGADLKAGRAVGRWVEAVGVVHTAKVGQDGLLVIELMTDSAQIVVRVAEEAREEVGRLVDARVRVRGVARAVATPRGVILRAEMLVPGVDEIETLVVAPSDPFSIDIASIAALARDGKPGVHRHRVRVRGTIAHTDNLGVAIGDQGQQLRVLTEQVEVPEEGATAEVVGFVYRADGVLSLDHAVLRAADATTKGSGAAADGARLALPRLTSIASIHSLTPVEAGRGYPVRLAAMVTYYDPVWRTLFVKDASGGIYVHERDSNADTIEPLLVRGARIEIDGVSATGDFAPIVASKRIRAVGQGELPAPERASIDALLSGRYDSAWVEMDGVVQAVTHDAEDGHALMTVASGSHTLRVVVPRVGDDTRLTHLVDAGVRLRGVCGAIFNKRRQLIGVQLLVPTLDDVIVERPAAPDPFALPARSVAALMQFDTNGMSGHRVRVRGVVTRQESADALFVRDETGGLQVLGDFATTLRPGDRVDLAGFPTQDAYAPVLRNALARRVGHGTPPEVRALTFDDGLSGDAHAELVRIEGRLIDRQWRHASGLLLTLELDDRVFTATIAGAPPRALSEIRLGSLVALTGICLVQVDHTTPGTSGQPVVQGFRLALQSASDVRVLEAAPWWTLAHLLAMLSVMTAVFAGAAAWVFVLRRRVRQQTDVIRRQLNQEASLKNEAEAANRAKSAFLANMSHEIRTPMNAVIGMTAVLLETPLSTDQRECVDIVRASSDGLLTIINDILDFSKIESGALELERHPFNLRECIDEALELFAATAGEKRIELTCHIDPTAPAAIVGDVTRLRQILVNLVNNAIKFTSEGSVVVSVAGAEVSPDGATELHFAVRDTGLGIPAERMHRLFRSFSQVDASTTRQHGGTGLGLAISKRLCELMGGRIWVESNIGHGSTFHFTIRAEAAPQAPRRQGIDEARALAGRTLLIVDHHEASRAAVAQQARRWGLVVTPVSSARDALDAVDRTSFDVAVLDADMPEVDGVALGALLRGRHDTRTMRLVLLTTLGRHERASSDTFDTRLSKPVKASALFDALLALIGRATVTDPRPEEVVEGRLSARIPLRILVADDNAVNQKVAVRVLARLGYHADVVSNGVEAVDAVMREHYDLVLMDVQMPEMDGLEATRLLCRDLEASRRPRIVAMTAEAMAGDRDRCLAAGMDDYVTKPVRLAELEAALLRSAKAA